MRQRTTTSTSKLRLLFSGVCLLWVLGVIKISCLLSVCLSFNLRTNVLINNDNSLKLRTLLANNSIKIEIAKNTALWTMETFECIGWQQTSSCDPDGLPEVGYEKSCSAPISNGISGYCVIRNRSSSAISRMILTSCNSLHRAGQFTCDIAMHFSNFKLLSESYRVFPGVDFNLVNSNLHRKNRFGIIMAVYKKVIESVYASIRVLRWHGCVLPIELWHRSDEIEPNNTLIQHLRQYHNVTIRVITDLTIHGFMIKPYILYYTSFQNALLLDADNIPTKDPTYLFDTKEFLQSGAIFWPDLWHPNNTIFNVHSKSLLWELTGISYVNMFEQESGQVLVNRTKHSKALNVLMFYVTHQPQLINLLDLVWGDKDLFRLSWLKTNSSFYMIPYPPATAGLHNNKWQRYCGLAIVQYDPLGEIIFFHRNAVKLTGKATDTIILTHLQQYSLKIDPMNYYIKPRCYSRLFRPYCCNGIMSYTKIKLANNRFTFTVTPIQNTSYYGLEEQMILYACEAKKMLSIDDHKVNFLLSNSNLYIGLLSGLLLTYCIIKRFNWLLRQIMLTRC